MKEDLIKLKELIESIIVKADLSKIDINTLHGTFQIKSFSEDKIFYRTISRTGDKEKINVRVGIDTEITLEKDGLSVTTTLENLINSYGR